MYLLVFGLKFHTLTSCEGVNLGDALIAAMKAIEESFEPLQGVLPKDYGIFDRTVLEDLLKIFNRDALKSAGGDVFGRIYEYFLMEFAIQGAQDNGEFFTPPSIVQMIVNVIEPGVGQPFNAKAGTIVLDPASGSGGMFVQSSHFMERMGMDAAHKLTFYGQEKTGTTIKLAKMNLAVHGLEGDIREANTFYTRTVPCELWFFDRGRPKDRRDKVLMLDARGVYRKVTRKIYDFSPEQLANLSAIVWLYRGQKDRFLCLVKGYLAAVCRECALIPPALDEFDTATKAVVDLLPSGGTPASASANTDRGAAVPPGTELTEAVDAYATDRDELLQVIAAYAKTTCRTLPTTNDKQHAARKAFDPVAERIKGLVKQADLIYKLAARCTDALGGTAAPPSVCENDAGGPAPSQRELRRLIKNLDAKRKAAVDQLKAAAYFHRQVVWLQDRFHDAELAPVPGLVKVVSTKEIEAADWSLTPGRYVGVAPPETDEDFDFEQSIRDIHVELASLNKEAAALANGIQESFQELGI